LRTLSHQPSKEATEVRKKATESIRNNVQSYYLICCLSEINNDILMWSHYALGHKGFCIQLHIYETPEGLGPVHIVDYPDDNKLPFINPVLYEEGKIDALKMMFLTKSKHWEYEQERRIFIKTGGSEFKEFPPQSLKGVIFGCRMEKEDEKQIREWISKGKCNPVFFKAVKKEDEFGLDILPL
jgi:hypothetical protein